MNLILNNSHMPNHYTHTDSVLHSYIIDTFKNNNSNSHYTRKIFNYTQTTTNSPRKTINDVKNSMILDNLSSTPDDKSSKINSKKSSFILDEKLMEVNSSPILKKSNEIKQVNFRNMQRKRVKSMSNIITNNINTTSMLLNTCSGNCTPNAPDSPFKFETIDNNVKSPIVNQEFNSLPVHHSSYPHHHLHAHPHNYCHGSEDFFNKYMNYLANVDKSMRFRKEDMEKRLLNVKISEPKNKPNLGRHASHHNLKVKDKSQRLIPHHYRQKIEGNKIDQTKMINFQKIKEDVLILKGKNIDSDTPKTSRYQTRTISLDNKVNETKSLPEHLIKELAFNLRQLAMNTLNENHRANALEKITNRNDKIIELILPKSNKLGEFDIQKLEKKFRSIEIISNENMNGMLPKLKKEGYIIDKSTLKKLEEFNDDLEEYNIQKNTETLKNMEDYLIKITNKIQEGEDEGKLQRLVKRPEMKELAKKRKIINMQNLMQPGYFNLSIADNINDIQQQYGEMKLVKRRNVAQSKSLKEIMDKWIQK